jgi:transposase
MKAYSQDFRQKILDIYHREKLSQRQLAKRFDVATSFIIKLLKQYRETGNIAPKAHGGGKPAQLSLAHLETIAELIAFDKDMTLAQLCDQFEQRYVMRVSRSTMGRAVQQLKLTVKKNVSGD